MQITYADGVPPTGSERIPIGPQSETTGRLVGFDRLDALRVFDVSALDI